MQSLNNVLSKSKTEKFSFSLSSGRSVYVFQLYLSSMKRVFFLVFLFLGYKQLCVINRFFKKKLAWSGQLQMGAFLTGVLYTSGVGGRLPAIGW